MKITKTEAKRLIYTARGLYSNYNGYEDIGENGYYAMLAIDVAIHDGVTAGEFKSDKSLQNHAQNLKNAICSGVY